MRVALQRTYNTESSLGQLQSVLKLVPRTVMTLRPGETISALVAERYGFGKTDHPRHYQAVEQAILLANKWGKPEDARPGDIQVPLVPSMGLSTQRRSHARVIKPSTPGDAVLFSGDLAAPTEHPTELPATTLMDMVVPAKDLSAFIADEPESAEIFFSSERTTLISGPMLVIPAAACTSPQRPAYTVPLTAAQVQPIKARLAAGSRNVYLFVLETGWPNDKVFVESRDELTSLLARACKVSRVPKLAVDLRKLAADFVPGHSHAAEVYAAIQDLAPLSARVKVVFVPLTKDQGAVDVLTAILTYGLARDRMWGIASTNNGPAGLSPNKIDQIVAEARKDVPVALSTILDQPQPNGYFITNPLLVDSLYTLASDALEGEMDSIFVVNESWTAPAAAFPMKMPDNARGLIAAAVGNDGKDVDQRGNRCAYATFAKQAPFVLAVMTLDAQGNPYCDTSCVDYAHPNMKAVGFHGTIPGGNCGSSFASPRVAWLLAARETLRTGPFPSDASLWAHEVSDRLRQLRPANQAAPTSLLFDPVAYITN